MLIINDVTCFPTPESSGIEVIIAGLTEQERLKLWAQLNNKLLDYWRALNLFPSTFKHGLLYDKTASGDTYTVMRLKLPEMPKQAKKETMAFLQDAYKYTSQMLRGTVMEEIIEVPVYSCLLPDYKEGDDPIVFIGFKASRLNDYEMFYLDDKYSNFAEYLENCTAEDNSELVDYARTNNDF